MLLLSLFVYSGRPLSRPHYDGKFFLGLHRDLGYAALLLLALSSRTSTNCTAIAT
ncbi:hypothetical protein D9M69_549700 [compost metagenome]